MSPKKSKDWAHEEIKNRLTVMMLNNEIIRRNLPKTKSSRPQRIEKCLNKNREEIMQLNSMINFIVSRKDKFPTT